MKPSMMKWISGISSFSNKAPRLLVGDPAGEVGAGRRHEGRHFARASGASRTSASMKTSRECRASSANVQHACCLPHQPSGSGPTGDQSDPGVPDAIGFDDRGGRVLRMVVEHQDLEIDSLTREHGPDARADHALLVTGRDQDREGQGDAARNAGRRRSVRVGDWRGRPGPGSRASARQTARRASWLGIARRLMGLVVGDEPPAANRREEPTADIVESADARRSSDHDLKRRRVAADGPTRRVGPARLRGPTPSAGSNRSTSRTDPSADGDERAEPHEQFREAVVPERILNRERNDGEFDARWSKCPSPSLKRVGRTRGSTNRPWAVIQSTDSGRASTASHV